jgi:hypothetical protein
MLGSRSSIAASAALVDRVVESVTMSVIDLEVEVEVVSSPGVVFAVQCISVRGTR